MKKILLLGVIAIFSINVSAQETRFGLTAGYLDIGVTAKYEGISVNIHESGFFVGALVDFSLSESFHIQPGANYGFVEDSGILMIPVTAKYYVANSGFNLQAGPQGTFILEENNGEVNTFGLDLGLGAGYDITRNFFVAARYNLELTNRLPKEFQDEFGEDISSRLNSFHVGLGYKF